MERRLHVACRVLGGISAYVHLGNHNHNFDVLCTLTMIDEARTLGGAFSVPWHFCSRWPQRNALTWLDLLDFAMTFVGPHSDSI